MPTKPIWVAAALTSVLCLDAAAAQERYPYLVKATNRLLEVHARAPEVKIADVSAVASEGCYALGLLLKDDAFQADLRRWARDTEDDAREAFTRDVTLFVDAFLTPESRLLRQAGYSEGAVQQLLVTAALFRSAAVGRVNPDQLMGSLARLRDDVCAGAETLRKQADRAQAVIALRRWALGLGGAAMVAADAAAAAPTAGVAAASISIGGAAVSAVLGSACCD